MIILQRYLIKLLIPVFFGALAFFVLILELADLFSNFSRFITYEVPFSSILAGMFLFVPKCVSFALPIAVLFSVSYTMGNFYSNNELIAIFSSGVSLYRLVTPVLVLGFALSAGSLLFDDLVVIKSFKAKNDHTRTLLKQKVSASNSNISILSRGGTVVWRVDYYNDETKTLSGVSVLERSSTGDFVSRVQASSAAWVEGKWSFKNVTRYFWNDDATFLTSSRMDAWTQDNLDESPETFRRGTELIEEMPLGDAAKSIERKRESGFSFSGDLAEYWKRWAFSLTPFLVILISCSIGGRFRKNILLMSLSVSLMTSVGYYVLQMVTMLLAKFERIPPFLGAWLPVFVFFGLGAALFRSART